MSDWWKISPACQGCNEYETCDEPCAFAMSFFGYQNKKAAICIFDIKEKEDMTEFEKFMQTIGTSSGIKFIVKIAKGNKEYEEKIMEFIKENNIDCNLMEEDTEEGVEAYRNWNKLIEYALELIPDEEE